MLGQNFYDVTKWKHGNPYEDIGAVINGIIADIKSTDNLLGAGFHGHTIYVENFGGLLVGVNNVFPRGSSSFIFPGWSGLRYRGTGFIRSIPAC